MSSIKEFLIAQEETHMEVIRNLIKGYEEVSLVDQTSKEAPLENVRWELFYKIAKEIFAYAIINIWNIDTEGAEEYLIETADFVVTINVGELMFEIEELEGGGGMSDSF